ASATVESEPQILVSDPEPPGPECPLETCAALTAELAYRPAGHDASLESHNLDASRWQAGSRRYQEEIRDEAKRGKRNLMRRFDAAYVAELERLRGPVTVD